MKHCRVIAFALSLLACEDDIQGPSGYSLLIEPIDASADRVFIEVHIPDATTVDSLLLYRNNIRIEGIILSSENTVISDTGLLAGSLYTYRVDLYGPSFHKTVSNTLSIETLQPSNHDFVWETHFLGEGNLSLLQDVVIMNDDAIWACGELYLRDSTGQFDPTAYNLAQWNGAVWTLNRVFFPICDSQGNEVGSHPFPCNSIHAFGETNVWMTEGGNLVQWDGLQFRRQCLPPGLLSGALTEIWGGQSLNLYGVGNNGTIVTTLSGVWQQVQSGTSTLINDVWGFVNPVTGQEEAYCAVSSFFVPGDRKIMRIHGLEADSVVWDASRSVNTVWSNKGYPIVAGGDGLFENFSGPWTEVDFGIAISSNCVRGNSLADIFVVGASGFLAHYNGLDWRLYDNVYPAHYFSVAVTDNMVVAVGSDFNLGVVTIGRRP